MPREDIYPYTPVPAFMTWEIPAEGVTLRIWQDGRCAMCGCGGRFVSLVEDHRLSVPPGCWGSRVAAKKAG